MDKVTSVEVAELRRVFALKLLDLPVDEIREHLMQFHVDMMDYFEQGPNEKVFVAAYNLYGAWVPQKERDF